MLGDNNDVINITGQQQIALAITSGAAVKSQPLPAGTYDIWCDQACFIAVNPYRLGNGALAVAADVSASNGYLLNANNTISIDVPEGCIVSGIAQSTSGTLRFVRTGYKSAAVRTENNYVAPATASQLGELSLSAATFASAAAPGTIVGAITGKTAGSTLAVTPNDGRVTIDGSNNLVVGLSVAAQGSFDINIRETLPGYSNSPRFKTFRIVVTASQPYVLPIALDYSPVLFAGTARMAGYSGNAIQAKKVNNTTQEIGFDSDNRVDMAAVDAFGGGPNTDIRCSIFRNQVLSSGVGDITTAAVGNAGKLLRIQQVDGVQPVTGGPNTQYTLPANLSIQANDFTVIFAIRPVSSHVGDSWINFGSNLGFGTVTPDTTGTGGLRLNDALNANPKTTQLVARSQMSVVGVSSGASDIKFICDRQVDTVAGGLAARTVTAGVMGSANTYNEIVAVAIYTRALTEAELRSEALKMEAIVKPKMAQTTGIVFLGNSNTAGQASMGNYDAISGATASVAQELHRLTGFSDDIAIFNFGMPSIPAASWDNRKAEILPQLKANRPQITKWIAIELNGINDYRAHNNGTQVSTRKKSICTYARSIGFKTIGTTVMKQGIVDANYTQTDQDNLDAGNVILKTNPSDYCDALVDLNALPNAQDPTNQTYFATDQLHHKPPLNRDKAAALYPAVQPFLAA